MRLNAKAWLGIVILGFIMALVLFVTADTVRYWQGWVYLFVFFGASSLITADLVRRDPALLERRLGGGPIAEKRTIEKLIMLFASGGFLALLIVPALDIALDGRESPQ